MTQLQGLGILLLIFGLVGCQSLVDVAATQAPPAQTPVILPVDPSLPQIATALPQEIIDIADAEHRLLNNIYERSAASVVNINVLSREEGVTADFRRGSGFVYDADGHIVTHARVVEGAQALEVTFNDGYITSARLLALDVYSDLAVLKVTVAPERLHPVIFSPTPTLRVGERAIAISNPFGLASSMQVGMVSGVGRQLPAAALLSASTFRNPSIIQVNVDVNIGNSGGPVLNSRAEVIGMLTAIRAESGVFSGMGFAIPISTIQRAVPELIADGEVNYAWLGISTLLEEEGFSVAGLAETLRLPVDSGVLVDRVTADSPAARAGIQGGTRRAVARGIEVCAGGDIIVAVNGTFVNNMDELLSYLVVNTRPGDEIQLLVVREDETLEIPVQLEVRPLVAGAAENNC